MKRTIVNVILLIALAALIWLGWKKFGSKSAPAENIDTAQTGSQVEKMLDTSSDNASGEMTMEVPIDNLEGFDYEGGGEYKVFFPQTVKDALASKKDIILFFYADRDPSDRALDLDLQKRKERIPKNTVILRIEYDSNEKLRESFDVQQQNTLIWLNTEGTELTRRAVGITSLSQVVRVQPYK